MIVIRLFRLTLTNLICELHRHGVYLDRENESDEESVNEQHSSLDEGIDDRSLSCMDSSARLSSHDNSDQLDTIDDHVF